jgi:hypothetical protein
MALVRIIHPEEYESREKRFKSSAFEPSDDAGISVVERDCAIEQSGELCAHIERYYKELIEGPPPVTFYLWTVADLPAGCAIENPEGFPDPCHRNITGFTKGKAKSFFKRAHWPEIEGVRRLVGIERCGPEHPEHQI